MPCLIKKRGMPRWKGTVMVNGQKREHLFPDDSKKSRKSATVWEEETRKILEAEQATPTVSILIEDWMQSYLDDVQDRFASKTYDEKNAAFTRLAKEDSVVANMAMEDITVTICRQFLQ